VGARRSNPYPYAAILVLATAAFISLQRPSEPAAVASAEPSAAAMRATLPRATLPPPVHVTPQHLLLGGETGFFIGDSWVTITLPENSEADYFPPELLQAQSPEGGITITTASADGSLCLSRSTPPSAIAGSEPPLHEVPGVGAASGSTFVLGGYAGRYLEFTRASGSCHPNVVWDSLVGAVGGRGLNVRLQLWLLDVEDQQLVLGRYTGMTEDAGALEGTRTIVASVRVTPRKATFAAGELPAGSVEPGWYRVSADNQTDQSHPEFVPFDFLIHVPGGPWTASGRIDAATGWQLVRGTPGTPDGAVVRIGRVDGVYRDPCSHEQAPPVDATASALADAVAAVPGVDVVERSRMRAHGETVEYVALSIPAGIPCAPEDFSLWYDDTQGPRAAQAIGTTIRLWIFTPNDRAIFGRLIFEAETYADEDAVPASDVLQMFDSIQHGG
jgi:hypothetical protein